MLKDDLSCGTFARHVGEIVRLAGESGATEAHLVEAEPLAVKPAKGEAGRPEPFALLFRALGHDRLPQGTYAVEHESWGSLEMFLVPVGPDAAGMRYEAIFN